jgi:hypothetical protein
MFGQAMIALDVRKPLQISLRWYLIREFYQHINSNLG